MMHWGNWLILVTAILVCEPASAHAIKPVTGRAHLVDGDTLTIRKIRFRLDFIDAFELKQQCSNGASQLYNCGIKARDYLAGLIHLQPITCMSRRLDKYGRRLADCHLGAKDLNEEMVKAGWAMAYLEYSKRYRPEQQQAQAARLGAWQGGFEMPWDWRREHRQECR